PQEKVAELVLFTCEFKLEDELIHNVSIAQAKNNNYINQLIRLPEVEFAEGGSTYYDENNVIGGATNRNIRDLFGSTLIFRPGSFATYAGLTIPNKSGEVTGVMTKFNSDFQFRSEERRVGKEWRLRRQTHQ